MIFCVLATWQRWREFFSYNTRPVSKSTTMARGAETLGAGFLGMVAIRVGWVVWEKPGIGMSVRMRSDRM